MTISGKGEEGLEGMIWELSCWASGDATGAFGCGEVATTMPVSCDEAFESLAEPDAIAEVRAGMDSTWQPLLKDVSQ